MIKRLLIAVFFTTSLGAAAQQGCDGMRYRTNVFANVDSTMGVQFGQSTSLAGNTWNLMMDIYEPQGDALAQRPAIVFAHGGSFTSGQREDFADICKDFARAGFVTATIDYRLLDALVFDSTQISEEVVMAIMDMRAAVRFLKEDAATANTYKVNPNLIFAGGISAGGIIASHVGFLDTADAIPGYVAGHINSEGGFEGSSSTNNTTYTSEVQGVLNYSGGLLRDHWIDANSPPFYSAHDDQDPTVPCTYSTTDAVPFPVFLHGSCEMRTRANSLGVYNGIFLDTNSSGHVSYFGNSNGVQVIQDSKDFLENVVCNTISIEENTDGPLITLYPNPSSGKFTLDVSATSNYHLEVYDRVGAKIIDQPLNENVIELHQKGVYIITLRNIDSGALVSQKILVQ